MLSHSRNAAPPHRTPPSRAPPLHLQVPCVGALSKDDVMGEVRAFDEASGLYTVALDSGVVKRGLTSDEVRVGRDRTKKLETARV